MKVAASAVALVLPLVGCQLLLDTNAPPERVVVLAPEGGGSTLDGGAVSTDASGPTRACPPLSLCEWFDNGAPGERGWALTVAPRTTLAPDSHDAVSLPSSLLVTVASGAPALTTFSMIERTRVTGTTPVKAATLDVRLKLEKIPSGQLVELVELAADTNDDSFTASLDLRENGVLSMVVIQNDAARLVDEPFNVNLLEWHRYRFTLDAARAHFSWRVDEGAIQERDLAFKAENAAFDVAAGLVWAQNNVTADLAMRYDDVIVSWQP